MALINRKQNSVFGPINHSFYHHFSGLDMDTIAPLIAHFYGIIEKEAKMPKPKLGSLPKIDTLTCYTYNVHSQTDLIFKLQNKRNRQITPIAENNFESSTSDLHFSSTLRYFRAGSPVMHNIFGTPYLFQPCLKVFDFHAKLTKEDITHIVSTFPHTFDLPCALARSLIYSFDRDELIDFLPELDILYPDILSQLLVYFSINSKFIKRNIHLIETHCQRYPEDICTAYYLLLHYLENGKIESAEKILPIFIGGIAVTPLAGIGLSRYSTYTGHYNEALLYLNTSGFSKCWPPLHKHGPPRETEPRNAQLGPGSTEKSLGSWPLQGPLFEMVRAIAAIFHDVGTNKFTDLCRDFIGSKNTPEPIIADEGTFLDLFDFLSVGNDMSLFDHDDNFPQKIEKDFLYDPGVATSAQSVCPGELENLAISNIFWAALKHTRSLASERLKLLSCQRNMGLLTHELILAIELGDTQMASGIANLLVSSRTVSGLDILLLQRAYTLGLVSATAALAPVPTTVVQTERNALVWNKNLVQRLNDLNS